MAALGELVKEARGEAGGLLGRAQVKRESSILQGALRDGSVRRLSARGKARESKLIPLFPCPACQGRQPRWSITSTTITFASDNHNLTTREQPEK